MPLPEDKKQVPITLPIEIIDKIDQLAKARYKTRAGYLSDVIIEYVIQQEQKKEDSQD